VLNVTSVFFARSQFQLQHKRCSVLARIYFGEK
jgi:hypothetical protein